MQATSGEAAEEAAESELARLVEQPAKVMRIGSMIKQLLEEVRGAPLDEASRRRLRDIHARSIAELEEGLAPELVQELDRLSLPFDADSAPSEAELRIAQAQLVGWLRASSTASRPPCSPSRWPLARNWSRCAGKPSPDRRPAAATPPTPVTASTSSADRIGTHSACGVSWPRQ